MRLLTLIIPLLLFSCKAQHKTALPNNELLVTLKADSKVYILVRDLVTVNSIETCIVAVEERSRQPLVWLFRFDEDKISRQQMITGLLEHPYVMAVE